MFVNQNRNSSGIALSDQLSVATLLLMAVVLSVYALLRYRGLWGEGDTAVFTAAIRSIRDTGMLVPGPNQHVYTNGYGYQALVASIVDLGGIGVHAVQLYGAALFMPWIVIPAWLLYREWTGTLRGATLATAILLVQPEFLFPMLRGTHEKFTRGLMLCSLYLLMRSLRSRQKPAHFGGLVLAFDLTTYSVIAFNNLFGSSFITATGLALVLSWFAFQINRSSIRPTGKAFRRLIYATATSMTLAILFTIYVYPPARYDLFVMKDMGARVIALFLNVRTSASNPYEVVSVGWVSLPAYFAVSFANWLLLVGSASIWASQSITWLRRRWHSQESSALLLWAFYGAFAFLGALSIAVDVSGALSSNLQQRVFPSFVMVAAPVVAKWLIDLEPRWPRLGRYVYAVLWAGMGVLAVLSTFKATNEPLLSNKWLFYEPDEMAALNWAGENLAGRTLWAGYDERLPTAIDIRTGIPRLNMTIAAGYPGPEVRDFLVSNIIRGRAVRLSQPLPVQSDDQITFDDGEAQVYHRRPETPFQR
jgi:hypothetical protein